MTKTNKIKQFGLIGLGKMGGGISLQAAEKGYSVSAYIRHDVSSEYTDAGIHTIRSLKEFSVVLQSPRIIFIYIPAGKAVDDVIDQLTSVLEAGDIIVDGGNSYWGDSVRRAAQLKEKKIHFIDCGTSGGISGARNGACFMIGGDREVAELVLPIVTDLAVEDGSVYTGPSGSGHFVKLVHNGIEFGMLQAIGEGINLLEKYPEKLNIQNILHCWNHGSVIRSWLVQLMEKTYLENNGMTQIPAYVEDTGEVNWLVTDAMKMEVPIPVISQSVMQLIASRDKEQLWAKAIAMMRHGFGGHPYGEDAGIRKERETGKVDGLIRK